MDWLLLFLILILIIACSGWATRRLMSARVSKRSARPASKSRFNSAVQFIAGGSGVLTAREMQIARLAAQAKRNAEIARELYLSVRTVENHLQNIYKKLNIRSRGELQSFFRNNSD